MDVKQIKETCLYINDLEGARNFYHELLGFPVIGNIPEKFIFFRTGTSVLLCFNPDKTRVEKHLPPHYAYGPQHLAFEVEEEKYESWKSFCHEKEIPIIHEANWEGGYRSFYFYDHEHNILEIVPEGMW